MLDLEPSSCDINSTLSSTSPIMHHFSAVLLLGSTLYQSVLGRPGSSSHVTQNSLYAKRSVADFFDKETPIALDKLLCNIGADGCQSSGASGGVVIASPSTQDPNCKSYDVKVDVKKRNPLTS